jgi:hypothetical protein
MYMPNLEFITAGTLLAAAFLPKYYRIVVPLAVMVITDKLIGNTNIFIFTWSAFGLIGLLSVSMKKYEKNIKTVGVSAIAAVLSSFFFFFYTNFGVWLMGDGIFYPKTWSGLMQCYVMGIPFYRNMLLGNLIIVPVYFAVAIYAPVLVKSIVSHRRTSTQTI